MHALRATLRISRLALVAFWLIAAAAASGCLDADRDALVVTPARPKSDDKPSRSATSLHKRSSETQEIRQSRPVRDARLDAELDRVDELLRSVGHQATADSRDDGSIRLASDDGEEEKKPRDKVRSQTNGRKASQRVEDLLPKGGRRNRLGKESSPYLLLHAHNPVDWYPWGPEAFETARRDNKLIFLSIGYSSCHWCHVMERLVFSN